MSKVVVPVNHFDREKPFYPLVMNYLVLLAGVKEFNLQGMLQLIVEKLSRSGLGHVRYVRRLEYELDPRIASLVGPASESTSLSEVLGRLETKLRAYSGPQGETQSLLEMVSDLESGLWKLAGPLQLSSVSQGMPLEVPMEFIANEIRDNHSYLLSFTMRSAASLLILAFETTRQYHDYGPLWEFLRHCRNAAAHNGQLRFERGEPRRRAEWGKIRLEPAMNGSNLFRRDEQTPGLLEPGDVIRLLWDIEQAYPRMKA